MLAKCPQFQAWVEEQYAIDAVAWPALEADQVTASLNYIALVDVPQGAGYSSPLAIIELPVNVERESLAVTGDGLDFDGGTGVLDLHFFRSIPVALRDDSAEAWVEFSGYDGSGTIRGLSGIITDLQALSASGTYLYITSFSVVSGPGFVEDCEVSEPFTIAASLRLQWGVGL